MITIYGASDDLIEIEGDIREEFMVYGEEAGYLAFSDGTLLHVEYDSEGMWRFHRLVSGLATYSKEEAVGDDGQRTNGLPAYSDIVTLICETEITWVVFGTQGHRVG